MAGRERCAVTASAAQQKTAPWKDPSAAAPVLLKVRILSSDDDEATKFVAISPGPALVESLVPSETTGAHTPEIAPVNEIK